MRKLFLLQKRRDILAKKSIYMVVVVLKVALSKTVENTRLLIITKGFAHGQVYLQQLQPFLI